MASSSVVIWGVSTNRARSAVRMQTIRLRAVASTDHSPCGALKGVRLAWAADGPSKEVLCFEGMTAQIAGFGPMRSWTANLAFRWHDSPGHVTTRGSGAETRHPAPPLPLRGTVADCVPAPSWQNTSDLMTHFRPQLGRSLRVVPAAGFQEHPTWPRSEWLRHHTPCRPNRQTKPPVGTMSRRSVSGRSHARRDSHKIVPLAEKAVDGSKRGRYID